MCNIHIHIRLHTYRYICNIYKCTPILAPVARELLGPKMPIICHRETGRIILQPCHGAPLQHEGLAHAIERPRVLLVVPRHIRGLVRFAMTVTATPPTTERLVSHTMIRKDVGT